MPTHGGWPGWVGLVKYQDSIPRTVTHVSTNRLTWLMRPPMLPLSQTQKDKWNRTAVDRQGNFLGLKGELIGGLRLLSREINAPAWWVSCNIWRCVLYSGRAPVNGPMYIGPMGRTVSDSGAQSASKLADYIKPWLQLRFDCDTTGIRLRSDYDVSRAPASIRRDSTRAKKLTCQFFVVVVS